MLDPLKKILGDLPFGTPTKFWESLTYRPDSQDAIATKNEMIYNLQYLYVLRQKIRLDRTLVLLIRCLVVKSEYIFLNVSIL